MDARPAEDCRPTGPPERSGAPRCPSCGSLIGKDASWCSLCHHDLRPLPGAQEPVPALESADPVDPPAEPATDGLDPPGGQLSLDLDLDLDVDLNLARSPDAAAARMLAELAVSEQRRRLPAWLSRIADEQSPGIRVAVGVAGVLLVTTLGMLGLAALGLLL